MVWYPFLVILGYLMVSFIVGTLWFAFGGPDI